ncbi:alanine aminotransferase 2-like [Ctenocephalides felis]|uniref:alanine aminotransferase 2-like n=1 Tax=Ctenocephalides felis TaxID=7515 RepID=UPI000E6E4BF9|nr:alanine aminotransferase 2-like [Ctenocephalides felis]
MEYIVRGPIVIRAAEIENEIKQGVKKPFSRIIRANIGDCHGMGQKYITFIRQVIALVAFPPLMDSPDFPSDAKERAAAILASCSGNSAGSYSESTGIPIIRQHIAEYIQRRDGGIPASAEDVLLTCGATGAITELMQLLACNEGDKKAGILVSIPQFPIYSANVAKFNMGQIGYYLNESDNWALDMNELDRAVEEGRNNNILPRAIVVMNPGNPTGQVLTRRNIEQIIKFAHKERLMIMADEVYQDNVYAEECEFHSFKKVLKEMGPPYDRIELASFMSTSKGWHGECGLRGGYMEIINLHPDVRTMLLKAASTVLGPATLGQVAVDAVVNPPRPGEPSYDLFIKEKQNVLNSLAERAQLVADAFNSFEGFSCNVVQGSMYAFPMIELPPKAIEAAHKAGKSPDVFYAFALLERTGICIVPGSGFGQKPGTYHIRTTILPQTDMLKDMLNKFAEFHKEFCAQYR